MNYKYFLNYIIWKFNLVRFNINLYLFLFCMFVYVFVDIKIVMFCWGICVLIFFLFVNEENGNIKKYYILIVIDKNFLVLNDKYFM